MKTVCIISILHQLVSNLLRFYTSSAKNDGINIWMIIHDTFQSLVFILCMNTIINMVYIVRTFVFASNGYFFRIMQVVLGYFLDLLIHSSRKHQRITSFRHSFKNGIQVL